MLDSELRGDNPLLFLSRSVLQAILGGACLLAVWNALYQPNSVPARLSDAQMMKILTTHCPALRQQSDVLGCLPDPAGIRLITDRPALMPPQVSDIPVLTEPPPPHLPPPPGVIILRPTGPDPQPTLNHCPPGYTEQQKYRWRFCNSPTAPQPLPTSLMIPPIAGVPYTRAEELFKRQDFGQLPGVQSVGLEADGLVVRTTEPALIPSTFEGLPVRTEAPVGVPRPSNHTGLTVPSPLKGGAMIGESGSVGTLGGFVWSGGEPWLVTAAHIFKSKCGDVPPCPANVLLHQCPRTSATGIPAYLAPLPSSLNRTLVSTLRRWTRLTNNAVLKAEAAAGFVDVTNRTISRRLEGFSRMVTGREATPLLNEAIWAVTAVDSWVYHNRPYASPHVLTGTVTATADNLIRVNEDNDRRVGFTCNNSNIVVGVQDTIRMEMNNVLLPGASGALMINGSGDILGMHFAAGTTIDNRLTGIGWAAKAAHIKAGLNFEKWVGSETVPLQGEFVSLTGARPTLRGWAYDPLNPNAPLEVEVYVDGEKGTGTKVETLTANQSHAGMSGTGQVSGQHGFESFILPDHSRSQFSLYALEPGDSAEWIKLSGSPKTPVWEDGSQSIDPRDGDPDANGNPQRIAISVDNDDPDLPDTNYPVHRNAKATVEAVLAAVHTNNTTPAITSININSTRRANSTPHSEGRAVDINEINREPVRCAHLDYSLDPTCRDETDLMNYLSETCRDELKKKCVGRAKSECEDGYRDANGNMIQLSDTCKADTSDLPLYTKTLKYKQMKKWVIALQKAFWKDCRVNQVLGSLINRNKWAHRKTSENPHDVTDKKTLKDHRDHLHINVFSQVRTCQ